MEPMIFSLPEKKLVGLATNVTLANAMEKGIKPDDVLKRMNDIINCVNDQEFIGLFTDPEDYNPETDEFEFFMGVEVSSDENVPEGMVYREVPANTYAKFTYQGPAEEKGTNVHAYFYSTWLRENGFVPAGPYNIEVYDIVHLNTGSVNEVLDDIYFPIKRITKTII